MFFPVLGLNAIGIQRVVGSDLPVFRVGVFISSTKRRVEVVQEDCDGILCSEDSLTNPTIAVIGNIISIKN